MQNLKFIFTDAKLNVIMFISSYIVDASFVCKSLRSSTNNTVSLQTKSTLKLFLPQIFPPFFPKLSKSLKVRKGLLFHSYNQLPVIENIKVLLHWTIACCLLQRDGDSLNDYTYVIYYKGTTIVLRLL